MSALEPRCERQLKHECEGAKVQGIVCLVQRQPWEPGKIEAVALTLLKGGLASQGVRDHSRESVRESPGDSLPWS